MGKMNMNDERQKRRSSDQAQKLYFTQLVFAASLLASTVVVIYNNSIRSLSIFVFFLFLSVGIMLTLGLVRGSLVGLLIISIWIAVKQLLGVWEAVRLLDNLLELIIVGLTFIFGGLYRDRLQIILDTYKENQNRLKQLDIEEKTVGLIKPSMGLLRLNEEEDRAIRYRRPFALILIMAQPVPGVDWQPEERSELMRAIATSVKDTTRETDIPFLAESNKIAVILPETETNGANRVVNNIFNRMIETQFVTRKGDSIPIQRRAQLRFGFAAFLGVGSVKINMMEAAEVSLEQSLKMNTGDLFQNIFIEWVTVGETPLSTPLFEKVTS